MKISKNNAEHYHWGALCDGWHLVKQPGLSVIHEQMPPGTSEVRHYHGQARQLFFILRGTAQLEVDGTLHELTEHEGCEVPPGVPHQITNSSEASVEFLVISQPGTRGDRFEAPPLG